MPKKQLKWFQVKVRFNAKATGTLEIEADSEYQSLLEVFRLRSFRGVKWELDSVEPGRFLELLSVTPVKSSKRK